MKQQDPPTASRHIKICPTNSAEYGQHSSTLVRLRS